MAHSLAKGLSNDRGPTTRGKRTAESERFRMRPMRSVIAKEKPELPKATKEPETRLLSLAQAKELCKPKHFPLLDAGYAIDLSPTQKIRRVKVGNGTRYELTTSAP